MKTKCVQCGTSFDAKRKNQKYCSDNCKQQAYYSRSSEKVENMKVVGKDYTFYMSEYNYVLKKYDDEAYPYFPGQLHKELNVVIFFFLRKNLPTEQMTSDVQLENLFKYIMGFCENENFKFNIVTKSKLFDEFGDRVFNGEYNIIL